ncbi:transposase [Vibrio coralliilyticus]|nr:transposase [Vibrio coralliilyticus]
MFCALHTIGRRLIWHPHVHVSSDPWWDKFTWRLEGTLLLS